MKVTGWTDWDNPEYTDIPGGTLYEDARELVIKEMRNNGYKFTGDYHQHGDYGVPIIDNKWLFQVSQRSWGRLMVEAYPDEIDDSDGYGYCLWAWMAPESMHVPDPKDYKEELCLQ